ncbi:MAG: DNA recombination protein RmuC, partial [Phaeodactylibacter sp.]|nr:DNA recombination protein RmuC [Phaeodactylibacter sp.]
MPDQQLLPFIFLFIGLLLGAALGWLASRLRQQKNLISKDEAEQAYVPKLLYRQVQEQADAYLGDIHEKEEELRILSGRLAGQEQVIRNLESQLDTQKGELAKLQEQSRAEF